MTGKRTLGELGRKAKIALTTKTGFKNAIEVQTSDFAPSSYGFIWSNAHMDPSPPSERTWTWFHYFAVWYSYNFTSGAWAAASSLLSLNVNWWQAVLACAVGSLISGVAVSLNSRQSARYHIGFPTLQRVSFGTEARFRRAILWMAANNPSRALWVALPRVLQSRRVSALDRRDRLSELTFSRRCIQACFTISRTMTIILTTQ